MLNKQNGFDEFLEDVIGTPKSEEEESNEEENEENEESNEEQEEEENDDGDQESDNENSDGDQSEDSNEDSSDSSDNGEEGDQESDEDSQTTPLDEANQRIEALTKLIESQALNQLGVPTKTPAPKADDPISPANADGAEVAKTLAEVVGEVDFDEFSQDNQKFVELLARVVDFTKEQTIATMRPEFNTVARTSANNAVTQQALIDSFYTDHSALKPFSQTVGLTAKVVATEDPKLTMEQVLVEAASRTYKLLGVEQPKVSTGKKKPVRVGVKKTTQPRKSKTTRKKKGADKRSKMQKEIDSLL